MKQLLSHYWPELLITIVIWAVIGWKMGLAAFFITAVLSLLEITLSADNAVVNSRILVKMSPFWQRLFMTAGILIAVFAVRFALPIGLVAAVTSLGWLDVFDLAINQPEIYGKYLHDIAPAINGFGGIFLFMVALFFFAESGREHLWLKWPEKALATLAAFPLAKYLVALLVFVPVFFITPFGDRERVVAALAAGAVTFLFLHTITVIMTGINKKNALKKQIGWAAFISFLYLEVLDASFSLDGVVGAFALTSNIVIIMAGLGIGALWVRTMTIYMVRRGTLLQYRYLESGAHWAIVCLSAIMFLKLAHIELPEIVVGSIGLVFIGSAVMASIRANRHDTEAVQ
ncbi:MAG: conserved rane protein of unknown function [Candidatus Saccharibacteria bacterium]|nr:conserved rane protein of unknown function [Candidatus Saccharibacteria bacterium]